MNRFIFLSVGVLVGACAALSCAHRAHPAVAPSTSQAVQLRPLTFDVNTGTFTVRGTMVRRDRGNDFLYTARLTFTLNTDASALHTDRVRLSRAILTASVIDEHNPPSHRRLLSRKSRVVHAEFVARGDTRTLPTLQFEFPKSLANHAEYITLELTDGNLLVRLPLNFRDYWR